MNNINEIYVYENWKSNTPSLIGTLYVDGGRGKQVVSFEYDEEWLKQLIAPGSSLGGARPKASVLAPDGSLWIAKFPSKHDEINVGAWEMVVHDLAVMCNLNVPEAKLENFSKAGSTFLIKRFDRKGDRRIHFASAMTLLGKKDGANAIGKSLRSNMDLAGVK